MNNINLYQGINETGERRKKMTIKDSGFFWSLSLLFFAVALFGGAKLVSANLKNKNQALESEIAQENASFGGSDLDRIVDFQVRVDKSNENITSKFDTADVFFAVENSMTRGSSAVSFTYSKEENSSPVVDMEILTGDFPAIARQILSFKENQSFKNISVKDIKRNENGISFKLTANFK